MNDTEKYVNEFVLNKLKELKKELRSIKVKSDLNYTLKVYSPYILWASMFLGIHIVNPYLTEKEKRPYNVEAHYDNLGNESERLLDKYEITGDSRLTIYDSYKESDERFTVNYSRDYEVYDISGLSLEMAKEIVYSDEPAKYLNMFGDPVEMGTEYEYEIIENEKAGYTKVDLYAPSTEEFYEDYTFETKISKIVLYPFFVILFMLVHDISAENKSKNRHYPRVYYNIKKDIKVLKKYKSIKKI